jgi:hypothetical protein
MRVGVVNSSETYNLAVHKIANYHRILGDEVTITNGGAIMLPGVWNADKVYFSCIFTWGLPEMVRYVNMLKERGIEIEIGGPAVTMMSGWVEEKTGIIPHVGLDDRFEKIPGEYKTVFTSRGCRNKCQFCCAWRIEPVPIEYDDFPIPTGANPWISDNNLLMTSWSHQKLVVERLKDVRNIDANSGFEAALFTEDHYQLYRNLHLERWRLAFDSMSAEPHIEKATAILRNHGVRYSNISVFVLIGFPGTTMEEAMYRLEKTRDLGCTPYPQRYVPLNSLVRHYTAPGFDDIELETLRSYWVSANVWRSCTWLDFKAKFKPGIKPGQELLL